MSILSVCWCYSSLLKATLNWALLNGNALSNSFTLAVPNPGPIKRDKKDIVYYSLFPYQCYWMDKTFHANHQLSSRMKILFSCFLPKICMYNHLQLSMQFAFQDIGHFK